MVFVAKPSLKTRDTGNAVQGHGSPANEADQSSNGNRSAPKRLAKSADPSFMKFTTYIKKTTHIGVKTRLVSKEKELSDLVEELLSNWLKKNESFKA
jgi:hypothetical protein